MSDTIFEECWIGSTLQYIHLFRITNETFSNQPFLEPSYGNHIKQLSFEGPCSTEQLLSTLDYFQETPSVVFGHGFFTADEYNNEMGDNSPHSRLLQFPNIKLFQAHCNVKKYNKLNELDQQTINFKTIYLLKVASKVLRNLTYCSLTLPNTPEIEEALNIFVGRISAIILGQKTVDYANKQAFIFFQN